MFSNILETKIDIEFISNSNLKSSQCNDEKVLTSEGKVYPVFFVKNIMKRYENSFKNFKSNMRAYPIKKIILEENCSPEVATMKDDFISKMEELCDNYQDIVEPLDLYEHRKKIKPICLFDFCKLFIMNEDKNFPKNYYLQRKRLEIELDNVFIDIYNQNKKKILPL